MSEVVGYTEGMGFVNREQEPVEFWWTFEGVKKRVSEIDHQHLSNIIHFMNYVNPGYPKSIKEGFITELRRRFDGITLPWMPLRRFTGEIEFLRERRWLKETDGKTLIVIDGVLIGQVAEE
jgi:hypothetical protein